MPDLDTHHLDGRCHKLSRAVANFLSELVPASFLNDRLVRRGIRIMAGSQQEKENP
jgi:hypothetical protein